MTESNRQFFRLSYPRSGRPGFILDGKSYEVAEVSEYGLRVALPSTEADEWSIESTVCGRVCFSDGGTFDVVGEIVRFEDVGNELHCALHLSEGIPYARIVAEQRFMLQVFPAAKKRK